MNGYKTYLLAAAAVLYGVAAWFTGEMTVVEAATWVWGGAAGAAIRHGISKVEAR